MSKLYIQCTILRVHSQRNFDKTIHPKISKIVVLPSVGCRTAFASRQYEVMGVRLYNGININY